MADQKNIHDINVTVNQVEILAPVIAAQLTTALYTSAVLEHLKGTKPDDLFNDKAVTAVIDTWMATWKVVEDAARKKLAGSDSK